MIAGAGSRAALAHAPHWKGNKTRNNTRAGIQSNNEFTRNIFSNQFQNPFNTRNIDNEKLLKNRLLECDKQEFSPQLNATVAPRCWIQARDQGHTLPVSLFFFFFWLTLIGKVPESRKRKVGKTFQGNRCLQEGKSSGDPASPSHSQISAGICRVLMLNIKVLTLMLSISQWNISVIDWRERTVQSIYIQCLSHDLIIVKPLFFSVISWADVWRKQFLLPFIIIQGIKVIWGSRTKDKWCAL